MSDDSFFVLRAGPMVDTTQESLTYVAVRCGIQDSRRERKKRNSEAKRKVSLRRP